MKNVVRENLLVGIGQPLLDIIATVDGDFLKKYNLKENDAIAATERHKNLHAELLEKYSVDFTVGGSILNTLRIIQWLIEIPNVTTFFGAVGCDNLASILFNKALIDGVNVHYQYVDNEPTGTCIVLITNNNRSLCTNPGSSKLFNIEYLNVPENKTLLHAAEYYYMGGFFLTISPDTLLEISKLVVSNKRQIIFNIGAVFICRNYKNFLIELMPYFDVIFGNKSEIEALAEALQIKSSNDIDELLLGIVNWQKLIDTRPRIVVLTQGENPVIVGRENNILKFPVEELENGKIVDTNGAGDAFAGGFLSQYIQGCDLKQCIKCGIWAATEIVQRIGCTYEGKASFNV